MKPGRGPDAATRDARRHTVDLVARRAIQLAGAVSIAVLVGIFVLLAVNAGHAFQGGIEAQPITDIERTQLTDRELAEIERARAAPPSLADMLLTADWRPDAFGANRYGVLALVVSTLLTTGIAMLIAVPVGVMTAAWLTFRARGRLRESIKFGIELIAAIPSVVVGFVGLVILGPALGKLVDRPGGLCALTGGILLAVMAMPTIISLSEDALRAVPRRIIEGSLALGADAWQTLLHVSLPAARSGLFAAAMLGMGRAIGETMTVLMATGNVAAMPHSLLDPVRTMTATIAIELGEVPRGTTHYYSLFAVGLLLFLITMVVNLAAEAVQRRSERLGL